MRRKLSFTAALVCVLTCAAHDFSLKDGSNTLYYNITDTIRHEVELTYSDGISDKHKTYEGELVIKHSVMYKGKSYTITAIGNKAFAGNDGLTSVEIPSGVKRIGDFAFENCQRLNRVILPTNDTRIGTGAFFRCDSISKLSIGSEWKSVDLNNFRWSKELRKLYIPARVTQIKNIVSLPYLQDITVDDNNARFMSYDGALYNASGTVMLACPRGRAGKLVLAEATETIRWGALSRCVGLEEIVLPKNVKYVSFREFAYLRNLKKLQMQMAGPIMTATLNGKNVMALQLADGSVKVEVLKSLKKEISNSMMSVAGKYSEIKANKTLSVPENIADVEYDLQEQMLASKAQIIGVKEFKNL